MSARVRLTAHALKLVARDPAEALDRIRSRIEHSADERKRRSILASYQASPDFDRRFHERLGTPFPCGATAEFDRTWNEIGEALAASKSFIGDWAHDADEGLARTLWCCVRHLHPHRVIETGVARGITSRVLLEALELNGEGHLWSIDLPLLRTPWHDQTAAAVPKSLRPRWTYMRGSSRRRLPGLLGEIGEIDLFVHDSAHTERNMRFEFETVWDALRGGGVLVSHDICRNPAFSNFAATTSGEPFFAQHPAVPGLVGIVVKNS